MEFFAHEAQTVTASRRLPPVREAPVAVRVITGEKIRTSGATNLRDLLRFHVGMDVLDGRSVDGNRAIVSVRGFPEEFVDRLQVLVDGRSVYNVYSGGVYWEQLPVQLQDIERIEIVRGPNAALYGSNAALGVVNIITKKPSSDRSVSAYLLRGNTDLFQSGTAYESAGDRFGYHGAYLDRRFQAEASLFYMKFEDLTASFVKQQGSFFPFSSPTTFPFDNSRKATAKRSELKLTYRFVPARSVYINYAYETIDDDGSTFTKSDRVLIEEATPKHKVNLGGMLRIVAGVSASVNAGYKSSCAITNSRQSEILRLLPIGVSMPGLPTIRSKMSSFLSGGKILRVRITASFQTSSKSRRRIMAASRSSIES